MPGLSCRLSIRPQVPAGKDPWWRMPVFSWHGGALSSMHDRTFISAAQARFPDLPRLTEAQVEALDLCDSLAGEEGVRLDMTLQPGDMQFIHNHQARARDGFSVISSRAAVPSALWRG